MVTFKHIVKWSSGFVLGFLLCPYAMAAWTLVEDESKVQFVSVKSDRIGELHHFSSLSGTVSDDGAVSVSIDLSSVSTNIEIRNQRMKEHLFETNKFPHGVIKGQLAPKQINKLSKGKPTEIEFSATIDLHGKQVSKIVTLTAIKLNRKEIHVFSTAPVLINASDFDLEKGIETLRTLAGLPNIALSVPVTFEFRLKKS